MGLCPRPSSTFKERAPRQNMDFSESGPRCIFPKSLQTKSFSGFSSNMYREDLTASKSSHKDTSATASDYHWPSAKRSGAVPQTFQHRCNDRFLHLFPKDSFAFPRFSSHGSFSVRKYEFQRAENEFQGKIGFRTFKFVSRTFKFVSRAFKFVFAPSNSFFVSWGCDAHP